MRQVFLLLIALCLSAVAMAQQSVTGKITDQSGEPLPGATVVVKGSSNGGITDIDGVFNITAQGSDILVLSFVGCESQEVPVNGRSEIGTIALQESSKEIDQVVVVGYGTQRKGDVTSAITSVKSEDFAEGNIRDASDLIKGKVAGLTIANGSGDPNAGSTIRLRGIISLQGSNSPLVLVDGVEGSMSTVAPENIESIDVLKDASAAAIYGTRGAGGVIIITTKAGKRDHKTTASYSGYVSASGFINELDMMDGSDIRNGLTQYNDKGYDTDWLDAISRTGVTQNHNFSINGGSKNTTYNADFTYRKQNGVIINTYGEDMHVNAGVSHWMFNDMLKVQVNLLKDIHQNGPVDAAGSMVYRQAIMRNPTEPIVNEDGSWYENYSINYYYNPVSILKEQKGEYKSNGTRMNGNITFEPIKGWQTNLMIGTERGSGHNKLYQTSKYFGQQQDYLTGYASQSYSGWKSDNLELTSRYKRTWGDHRFEGMVGYSYQYNMDESFYANNTNFMSDYYGADNMGIGQWLKDGKAGLGSYKGDDKLVGFFGRVSYGYADKYNVLASIRREGSSKFGDNNKWGTFSSASLGWTISNEEFMKNISIINNLRLRAGFGETGVVPGSRYLSLTTWALGTYYYEDGKWKQGLVVNQNPNPDLKWEKSTEWNIGLDFALLDSRISGSIDLYNKQTKDMLWSYTVPTPPNLYNTTLANVGKMENKGIELTLSGVPVKVAGFEWKTTVTASHNQNQLKSLSNDLYESANYIDMAYLGEPISLSTQRIEVGQSLGQFFGLKSVGVSENGLWLIENAKTGEIEEFNDNMLTDFDNYHQYLGNALPKVYLGWTNTFTYKNFDLNTVFTGQFGFNILNEARAYYENNAVTYNRLKSAAEAPYGDYVLSPAQKQTFVSYYLEKGDFFKLSSITLGYTVPLKENKYVKSIRVSASADNLFTITGYSGLDPEISNGDITSPGIDWRDKYPTVRTFTFGVNINF